MNKRNMRVFYEDLLQYDFIPYWSKYVDEEYGGILNCISNSGGQLLGEDKFTWSQGRWLWILGKLHELKKKGVFRALSREQLEKWYRREAAAVFEEKAEEFAKRLHVSFQDIRIKDQKSRWGSCSSKRNMNFNWRLLMAPEPVCDYGILHELCHLIHMNHSADFWNLVESICPDYRQYKKWLREKGKLLYPF